MKKYRNSHICCINYFSIVVFLLFAIFIGNIYGYGDTCMSRRLQSIVLHCPDTVIVEDDYMKIYELEIGPIGNNGTISIDIIVNENKAKMLVVTYEDINTMVIMVDSGITCTWDEITTFKDGYKINPSGYYEFMLPHLESIVDYMEQYNYNYSA